MYRDPTFWRGKAQRFREIAEESEPGVLAEALRSRADEIDALASRIEAGGPASASFPRRRGAEMRRED